MDKTTSSAVCGSTSLIHYVSENGPWFTLAPKELEPTQTTTLRFKKHKPPPFFLLWDMCVCSIPWLVHFATVPSIDTTGSSRVLVSQGPGFSLIFRCTQGSGFIHETCQGTSECILFHIDGLFYFSPNFLFFYLKPGLETYSSMHFI